MKILLAEDDHNVSVIMQLCLEKIGGHTVVLVEDGQKAFDRASSEHFDLIILDGMMPKLTGVQVARALRDAKSQTPVIFLSAKNDEKEFLTLGTGFIPKPFEPTQICARIDEILARSGKAVG